eukprot:10974963-Karenia_brevis.AAC.1
MDGGFTQICPPHDFNVVEKGEIPCEDWKSFRTIVIMSFKYTPAKSITAKRRTTAGMQSMVINMWNMVCSNQSQPPLVR